MKAFDFDNTLYRGESTVDLLIYLIRKNKRIALWMPLIFFNLIKYKLCLISGEHMEAIADRFFKAVLLDKAELIRSVEDFWERYSYKLEPAMLGRIGSDDLIITAGPSFLFEPIKDRLGTQNLICSEVDLDEMKLTYLNFSGNKVKRFREVYGERKIDIFYTDSYNDQAMMDISERVYLIKIKKRRVKRIK